MSILSTSVHALSQVNSLRSTSATNGAGALDSILQMFGDATDQSPGLPPAVSSGGPTPISATNAFDPSTFNALLSVQEQANDAVSGVQPNIADGVSSTLDQIGEMAGPLASVAMLALI